MQFLAIPKRRSYPILGLILALGAPGGLLAIRAFVVAEGEGATWPWIAAELSSRALTYGYVTLSTAIVFVGLGFVIGSHEDTLQRLSITDPLTGLPNRRHFEQRLGEELARATRHDHPLALMLLDLDGLKRVNDTSGHDAGDDALRAVARALQGTRRTTDVAARTGGDEFAVLAPNITGSEAETLAERPALSDRRSGPVPGQASRQGPCGAGTTGGAGSGAAERGVGSGVTGPRPAPDRQGPRGSPRS